MKKIFNIVVLSGICIFAFAQTNEPVNVPNINRATIKPIDVGLMTDKNVNNNIAGSPVVAGLKQALIQGTNKATTRLSATDGFLKDPSVKILLPEDVEKIKMKYKLIGMGNLLDELVQSMNRVAEDATKSAAPIFIKVINQMNMQNPVLILKGADTAATAYLLKTTMNELVNNFRPIMESSLKKMNTAKYWGDVYTVYNKIAPQQANTDLNEYVTNRTLKGIFYYIQEEEKNIRNNPAARETDVLKNTFSGK